MSKLLSEGGFGCVYYPGIQCDGKKDSRKNVVTKLQKEDFNANNEIEMGKIIMKLPNYRLFFLPVVSSCQVNIHDMDSSVVNECHVVAKGEKVPIVLMTIPYISNEPFFSLLISTTMGKKQVILTITETYSYLLSAIQYLIDMQIVHFDIKGDNILYNKITADPQVIDFGISLPIEQLNPDNWAKYFYVYAPEYYLWPLEVHVIGYLLHVVDGTLSEEDIVRIASEYEKHNKGLDIFSKEFREKYKKLSEEVLKKYVGMPRDKVIKKLIAQYTTWDNYSLSVMYLKTFFLHVSGRDS